MSQSAQQMINSSKCLECGLPEGAQLPILISIFANIAGMSTDPNTLMEAAKCVMCIPNGAQLPVLISLADQILAGGGGGGGGTGTVTSVGVNSTTLDITNSPVTESGNIGANLKVVGTVIPGSYTNVNITVDSYGRITSVSNGEINSASGVSELDFGSTPGTNQVSVVVTGQSGITSTSFIKAFLSPSTTSDRNLEEIKLISANIGILAHTISEGIGFTITATTQLRLTGKINVCWEWSLV